jgi:predicted DNA-binding protein with PD1-like motif
LKAFTDIYNKANQHNIKTWKAKALHQLLDMHIKMKNGAEAKKTLHIIREMN